MTGTKPYILRALYEWCLDNGQTPHIVVWVNEHTRVPMRFVKDNQIVLNIGPNAVKDLVIDNDWVHFSARFSGVVHDIWVPVGYVMHFFARESGEGFGFEVEPRETENMAQPEAASETTQPEKGGDTDKLAKGLKLVK